MIQELLFIVSTNKFNPLSRLPSMASNSYGITTVKPQVFLLTLIVIWNRYSTDKLRNIKIFVLFNSLDTISCFKLIYSVSGVGMYVTLVIYRIWRTFSVRPSEGHEGRPWRRCARRTRWPCSPWFPRTRPSCRRTWARCRARCSGTTPTLRRWDSTCWGRRWARGRSPRSRRRCIYPPERRYGQMFCSCCSCCSCLLAPNSSIWFQVYIKIQVVFDEVLFELIRIIQKLFYFIYRKVMLFHFYWNNPTANEFSGKDLCYQLYENITLPMFYW